jgi:hydrogenase maturation factor
MLRPGKLPQAALAKLLARIAPRDPRVLIGPGIGRDAAVIDLGGGRVLVAKTDPITFATEHIGWYAANVNANDVACMGARPAWMLAAALLPPGADEGLPGRIFDQLAAACAGLGVELVGGHTEITIGLDRPIIAGSMLGEAAADEIVGRETARPGDRVLLTKGIAVEGTSLLAREAATALRAARVGDATIERAAAMLFDPGISVVPDARAICGVTRPRLLHDPTEGGISGALYELAEAAGATLRVDAAAIAVYGETRALCDALALDPQGLIASGALLAVIPADASQAVAGTLDDAGIESREIGTVEPGPPAVIMGDGAAFPRFERDEIARYFAGEGEHG